MTRLNRVHFQYSCIIQERELCHEGDIEEKNRRGNATIFAATVMPFQHEISEESLFSFQLIVLLVAQ